MDLFELSARIKLDTNEYEQGLKNSEEKTGSFASKLKTGLGNAGKIAGASVLATGTAIAGTTTALVNGTKKVAEYGDHIDKMSQKMGISAEAYQEWDFILQHSGSSIDTMKASMKTLATAVEGGSDAFEKLGITQQDLAKMNQEQIFEATIKGLQGVEDTTERTYLAGKLLGRGATELGALLNTSAEDVDAMKQQVHDLGGVMSDEAVKNSAQFQDSLQNLQTGFDGAKRGLMEQFLPSLTTVMDGLSGLFSGEGGAIEKVSQGILGFFNKIASELPKFMETGSQLITALVNGIGKDIGKISESAVETVMLLVNTLLTNLPQIIEIGMTLLVSLINGLSNGLPQLIAMLPTIINTIVKILVQNLPLLITAGVTLLVAIINGISQALPQLVGYIPSIVASIVKVLVANVPQVLSAGVQIIKGLVSGITSSIPTLMSSLASVGGQIVNGVWSGISAKVGWFTNKVRSFFKGIVDNVKSALGIHSPSKVFAEIGGYMAEGLGVGWEDEIKPITTDINKSLEFNAPSGLGGGTTTNNVAPVFNIYGAVGQDVEELANIIEEKFVESIGRRSAVYG